MTEYPLPSSYRACTRAQSLLPDHAEQALEGFHHDSCAVVGNSGMLRKTAYGAEIDGHACVARLNNVRPLSTQAVRWLNTVATRDPGLARSGEEASKVLRSGDLSAVQASTTGWHQRRSRI